MVLCGAFGGTNIGDELILLADARLARGAGYEGQFTALTFGNATLSEEASAEYARNDIEPASLRRPGAALRSILGKDLLIGGGQVLDGSYGAKLPFLQLCVALACRLSGGRVWIGGAGALAIKGRLTKLLYHLLFILTEDVSVRDQASYDAVAYSEGNRRRVRVAADVVFSLFESDMIPTSTSRSETVLAVHNAPHVKFMDQDLAVPLAEHLALVSAGSLTLAAHDARENFDLGFASKIASGFSQGKEKRPPDIQTFDSVEACLDFYSQKSLVVSARMHPLIIGAIAGCACVPLAGSSKVAEFARLTGLRLYTPADVMKANAQELLQYPDKKALRSLAAAARSILPILAKV